MCWASFSACTKPELNGTFESFNLNLGSPVRKIIPLDQNRVLVIGGNRYQSAYCLLCNTVQGIICNSVALPLPENVFSPMDAAMNTTGQVIIAGYGGQLYFSPNRGESWEFAQQVSYSEYEACAIFPDKRILTLGGVDRKQGFVCLSDENWWSLACNNIPSKAMGVDIRKDTWVLAACEGNILLSKDRGLSFVPTNGTGDYFRRFAFPTPDTGYVCGAFGSILRTIDAGQHWESMKRAAVRPVRSLVLDISFFDQNHGAIAGTSGLLEITKDGGLSWQKVAVSNAIDLYSIHMIHKNTLVAGDAKGNLHLIQF
jgi:hypothetical protein